MTVAIFPGSFDPITKGHVDVVEQASRMFDQIYLTIMTNTHKKYLFSASERTELAVDAVKNISNVKVLERPNLLTMKLAEELHANAIVRGVRNSQDFLYEQQVAGINRELNPRINTVLLFTAPENSFVASSMVKETAKFGGDIRKFLPAKAAQAMKKVMQDYEEG